MGQLSVAIQQESTRRIEAEVKLADVEKDLAEQREKTAKAEKDLLELQQTLADRKLSDEQFREVVKALKPFSGQEYEVTAYRDSKESVAIAERINEALQAAGWSFLPMKEYRVMPGVVVGVLVWSHPEADEKTKKAADSLTTVFLNQGIQTERRLQNPINNPKHNKISLSVGAKR
jgi:hypothetical protein